MIPAGVIITWCNITRYSIFSTAVTQALGKSEFVLNKDTPYLNLTDELQGFGGNWPRYNGTTLYFGGMLYSITCFLHKTTCSCICSVGEKRWKFPTARPKCLMGDFTNLYRIYKAHQTDVFRLHGTWLLDENKHFCSMFRFNSTAYNFNKSDHNLMKIKPNGILLNMNI